MRPFGVPGWPILLFNFGGNSSSSTQNTENVTQPTATGGGSGSGQVNVATTGQTTISEESPQALNDLNNAITATENVALQALNSEQATAGQTQAVIGKTQETTTQQWGPIVLGLAAVAGLVYFFAHRKA